MSDLDSRNAGLNGLSMPAGGNQNEFEAGRAIRNWNQAELGRQNAAGPAPYELIGPTAPALQSPFGRNAGPVQNAENARGNPFGAIGGLLLLIFVGAPLYPYSIPLWACLYPVAASIAGIIYSAVFAYCATDSLFTGSGRIYFPAFIAFVAAWPLTMVDQNLAVRRRGYWLVRHVARLGLIGLWVIYALSRPRGAREFLPHLVFSPLHIGLALAGAVGMHLFLVKRPMMGNMFRRKRPIDLGRYSP